MTSQWTYLGYNLGLVCLFFFRFESILGWDHNGLCQQRTLFDNEGWFFIAAIMLLGQREVMDWMIIGQWVRVHRWIAPLGVIGLNFWFVLFLRAHCRRDVDAADQNTTKGPDGSTTVQRACSLSRRKGKDAMFELYPED